MGGAEDWGVAVEEEGAVGDFLWVGADPGVEDGDGEEEEGDLAGEAEEAGFWEEWGVVGEVPACEEDDGGGEREGGEDSREGCFQVLEVPEDAVVEGGVFAEVDEHGGEGEEEEGEDENGGGESGVEGDEVEIEACEEIGGEVGLGEGGDERRDEDVEEGPFDPEPCVGVEGSRERGLGRGLGIWVCGIELGQNGFLRVWGRWVFWGWVPKILTHRKWKFH